MGVYQPNSSSKKYYEKIDNFFGGINIVDEANKLGDNEFRNLENISLMNEGSVKKRTGYREVFNFRNSPYFHHIYNPSETTHFEIEANFPDKWGDTRENTNQMNQIVEFAKQFRLLVNNNTKYSLKLTYNTHINKYNLDERYFKIDSNVGDIIKNNNWDQDYFSLTDTSDEVTSLNSLSRDYFIYPVLPEISIPNFIIDFDIQNYDTVIVSSDETTKKITITINDVNYEFDAFIEDWTQITNVKWIFDINNFDKPEPDTLEFEKFEEIYSDPLELNRKELLGYLVAYKYNEKLWFTYYQLPIPELQEEDWILLEWYLIEDRLELDDNGVPKDKVNQYKFIGSPELIYPPLSYSTVEIKRNSDFYFNPNLEPLGVDGELQYPYVGVDIKTYRNKIYITTGYGILEVTNNDIIESKSLYEIIPFKPQTAEYQNNYSNLLALNLRSPNITISNLKTKFLNIWNWDWVEWPKTTHLSGIISKYPPNSEYNTVMRASINFADEQMVGWWQYQWRWVAPQELQQGETVVDDTMPIISDFQTHNYELTWKPIVRPETVNTYVITDPTVKTTKQALINDSVARVGGRNETKHFTEFYLGGDNGAEGAASKFDITNVLTTMTDIKQFKTLDLLGNLLINVEINQDASLQDPVKLQPFTMSNWRIEVWIDETKIDGDESQETGWGKKGWWKLQTTTQEWGEDSWYRRYHNYSHRLFPLSVVNNEKFLETVGKAVSSGTVKGYLKILCDLKIGQYAHGAGTTNNTTVTIGINPNSSQWNANGLTFGLGYVTINVADSNTIGLTPIDNIEQTLNLESLHLVKECTNIAIIKDQMFIWGSKSAPQMIWYSQPFNPSYISVINTIALNRLANEIVKAIEPFGQNFLIFTDKTIYIMSFSNQGISIEIGNPNLGIEYRDSVVGVGNSIIFLSYDGIYQIRSSGMDINHTIKINSIDRTIKGIFDLQDITHAVATSEGENYLLLLQNSFGEHKILNYYSLRKIWTQYTTNNNFFFKQMDNLRGKMFTLTNDGILNQWYTQIEEKILLERSQKIKDSNEFLLKIMQLYSDGYEYKQTRFEKLSETQPKPELKLELPDGTVLYGLDVIKEAPIQSTFYVSDEDFNYIKKEEDNWKKYSDMITTTVSDEYVFNKWNSVSSSVSYLGLIFVNYILDYEFYKIECEILTKEFSGAGENIHNLKKFKEVQLKQIRNVFATQSELTIYNDGIESLYPYEWDFRIQGDEYLAFKKSIQNYVQNSGSFVNESLYMTDLGAPTSVYTTKLGDNTEYNARFKKGQKSYTTQIKVNNKQNLPFGLKSLLLVYKFRKAK